MSQKIKILPEAVISRICAGEVIDRPSSAIKELIENSLDAHARSVTVNILSRDFLSFSVRDDGTGMSPEDIKLSVKRYSTSKLEKEDDLLNLSTYGFRGEALHSIATISRLIIRSAETDGEGYECYFEGGILRGEKPVNMKRGTLIEVHDLFFNSPVRRKFLRGRRSEFLHVTDLIFRYALSFPEAEYLLKEEEREIIRIERGMDIKGLFELIFGKETKGFEIHHEEGRIKVYGYFSLPEHSPLLRRIYLIVNRRPVDSGFVREAISSGFGRSVEKGRNPSGILFIHLPPEDVDLNVHPAKKVVRFREAGAVERAIIEGIKRGLSRRVREAVMMPEVEVHRPSVETECGVREAVQSFLVEPLPKVIGNLWNEFMVVEREDSVLFIDIHAAHEKILYDQLKEWYESGEPGISFFLVPLVVNLGKIAEAVENLKEELEKFGFVVERFGRDDVCIRGYPSILDEENVVEAFKELLNSLINEAPLKGIEKLAGIACRRAVKGGTVLTTTELISLLDELKELKGGSYCPHGRPVVYILEKKEILRWFSRK